MAHLLNGENVSLAYPNRTVLDGVSLGLDDGDRIGVVGANGAGKSSLLALLTLRQAPDSGRITHRRDLAVSFLDQREELVSDGRTVGDEITAGAPAHEWAAMARVRDVVAGLLGGLEASAVGGLDAPLSSLSGGQRRRVALARVLAAEADLLVLDEPTNHLDVSGVAWLADHLQTHWPKGRGGLVVVTHDRWFLDAVATRTWEVHDGIIDTYDGGYGAYVLARAERARVEAATASRRNNLLRKELAWLQRGAPARTSKPRYRIDAAEALIADEPPPRDSLQLSALAMSRLGKEVLTLEDATIAFGDNTVLDRVTWLLGPGDRIGVLGPNGAGKTTLLRLILGEVQATSGSVRRGKTVRPAFLSQHVRELEEFENKPALEAVAAVATSVQIGDKDVSAAKLMERLGFARDRAYTLTGELSGGERRRLQLLRLLMDSPNVLVLDEPTNDLDTDTLTAVEDVLDGWPGTLIVVSHDRYLLERICDRWIAVTGNGQIRDLPSGVDSYLELMAAQQAATTAAATGAAASATSGPAVDAAAARQARKDMARWDKVMERLARQRTKLIQTMADSATDHAELSRLDAQLRTLDAEVAAAEAEWLAAAELAE